MAKKHFILCAHTVDGQGHKLDINLLVTRGKNLEDAARRLNASVPSVAAGSSKSMANVRIQLGNNALIRLASILSEAARRHEPSGSLALAVSKEYTFLCSCSSFTLQQVPAF